MKKIVGIILIVIAATITPIMAQAVPITVTATGQITSSADANGFFGLGSGSNTLLGANITATWTFNSDDAGPNILPPSPTAANYDPDTDFMESSVLIETDTLDLNYDLSDLIDVRTSTNSTIVIRDNSEGGTTDTYQITDRNFFGSPVKRASLSAFLKTDSSVDIIASLLPAQTFTWNSTDFSSIFAQGGFNYVDATGSTFQAAEFDYELHTLTVTAGSVPEPSTVLLLSLRQRKKKISAA